MPFVSRALAVHPNRLAVEDGPNAWTYRELSMRAEEVARQLGTIGVRSGDVVALAGQLDARVLAALHGIWKAGGRPAPLNPAWTRDEAEKALALLKPRILLQGSLPERQRGGPPLPEDLEAYSLCPPNDSPLPPLAGVEAGPVSSPALREEDPCAYLRTSGTSGQPGVIPLTTPNLLASAAASAQRLGLRATDRWLCSLSLAHVGGLAMVTRAACLGSTLILRGDFRPDDFLDLARKGFITHASLVPTMLHHALEEWGGRRAPRSLECLLVGGAGMALRLMEKALATDFPVALTYGMTEASSQVATAPPSLVRRKPGTVGAPLRGVEVRLNSGGEILVKGPTVADSHAVREGWLHTGDLGREDDEGHLWIIGRLSDRIISGGLNVDPTEVEAVLLAHPGVREAAVVGIPDEEWGERVVVAVVGGDSGFRDASELERLAWAVLSPAKRPREIRFVAGLPRNSTGKVDRKRLRDLFR
jgi:O-succinylbenzoic acid--CoA ligase